MNPSSVRPRIPSGLLLAIFLAIGASLLIGLMAALDLSTGILALLTAILFIFLGFTQPHLTIWLLVCYTVLEETAMRWLPSEVRYSVEFAILLLILFNLLGQIWKERKIRFRRTVIDIPLLLFLSAALISSVSNQSLPIVFILGVRPWIRYIALFYLVTLLDWPEGYQKKFMWGLLCLALFETTIGLFQAVGGRTIASFFAAPDVEFGGIVTQQIDPGLIGTKIFGTLARYDRFGNYLMLMLLFGIAAYPATRSGARFLLSLAIGLLSLGLLFSFSRQAWVGAGIGLVVILIMDKRKFAFIGGLILLAIILSVFILAEPPSGTTSGGNPASVVTRLLEPFTEAYWVAQNSTGGRAYYLLVIGPKILENAPLFGFGPGRFASVVTRIYPTSVYEQLAVSRFFYENFALDIQWMAMFGQVGLVGLALFLTMIARLWTQAFREFRALKSGNFRGTLALTFTAWTLAILFVSLLGPNIEVRVISMHFWLLGGLVTVNSGILRGQSNEDPVA